MTDGTLFEANESLDSLVSIDHVYLTENKIMSHIPGVVPPDYSPQYY